MNQSTTALAVGGAGCSTPAALALPPLTYKEAAARLGVTHWAVKKWVRQGRLRCLRMGYRTRRIREIDLEAFMEKRTR